MNHKTNQTSRPKPPAPPQNPEINNQGLTIRDYFATHAMEGMVTDVVIDVQKVARMAYQVADAMMKERGINRGQ